MKKKLLLFGFLCSLSPVAHAKDQMHKTTSHVAPVLDETDDEMTEEEAAAAAAIVPVQQSAFQQWCIAKIRSILTFYMRCKNYMPALRWANRTKKRRKRMARG